MTACSTCGRPVDLAAEHTKVLRHTEIERGDIVTVLNPEVLTVHHLHCAPRSPRTPAAVRVVAAALDAVQAWWRAGRRR